MAWTEDIIQRLSQQLLQKYHTFKLNVANSTRILKKSLRFLEWQFKTLVQQIANRSNSEM